MTLGRTGDSRECSRRMERGKMGAMMVGMGSRGQFDRLVQRKNYTDSKGET